jgi:hypothetical protein
MEAKPENPLQEVWAYLSPEDARQLLQALQYWADEQPSDTDWHYRIADSGRELTIAIGRDAAKGHLAR